MKQAEYICEICGDLYQAGKEHDYPKHCRVCAECLNPTLPIDVTN